MEELWGNIKINIINHLSTNHNVRRYVVTLAIVVIVAMDALITTHITAFVFSIDNAKSKKQTTITTTLIMVKGC